MTLAGFKLVSQVYDADAVFTRLTSRAFSTLILLIFIAIILIIHVLLCCVVANFSIQLLFFVKSKSTEYNAKCGIARI